MDPVDLCQVSSILIPCAKAGRLQMNLRIPAHASTRARLSSWRVSASNEQTPTSALRGVNLFSAVGRLVILRTPGRLDVGRPVKPVAEDVRAFAGVCAAGVTASDGGYTA